MKFILLIILITLIFNRDKTLRKKWDFRPLKADAENPTHFYSLIPEINLSEPYLNLAKGDRANDGAFNRDKRPYQYFERLLNTKKIFPIVQSGLSTIDIYPRLDPRKMTTLNVNPNSTNRGYITDVTKCPSGKQCNDNLAYLHKQPQDETPVIQSAPQAQIIPVQVDPVPVVKVDDDKKP